MAPGHGRMPGPNGGRGVVGEVRVRAVADRRQRHTRALGDEERAELRARAHQHVGAEDVEQVLELDDLRRGIAEEHVTEHGPRAA